MSTLVPLVLAQVADASRVGVGRIVGGWNYVAAGYGIAWAGFAAYALSLWLRRPRTELKSPRNP